MVVIDSTLTGAIGGALIAVAGSIIVSHLSKKRSKVAYEKTSISAMMDVNYRIKDKIKVEYENKPISNIYSFNIKIKNKGNTEVEKLPLLFEFDSNTKVLAINIETSPRREFKIEKIDTDKESDLKYEIDFLNPKDCVVFDILTANNESEYLGVYARVKGLIFYESRIVDPREMMIALSKNYIEMIIMTMRI